MKSPALIGAIVFVLAVGVITAQDTKPAGPSLMKASFGKLPIYFIENRGVYPDEVKFYVQGADKTLFITKEGITFRLKGKDRSWVVKLEFVGANPDAIPIGKDQQQAIFSYFMGSEKDWKTVLRTYAKVVYEDLWPGIDLIYKGTVNRLKYEFVVNPGADPEKIRLRYHGVTSVALSKAGALKVETPEGGFEDALPMAWQEIGSERVPVEMAFSLACETDLRRQEFGLLVGDYDRTRPLILDPAILVYCGYIGGASREGGNGIAVDGAGNAYVTGETESDQQTFPVTVGPDLTYNDTGIYYDAFVAKVNALGTSLVYCGYIGGIGHDWGAAIALDARGNAYVSGTTQSTEQTFPVVVGPDLSHNGGGILGDVFVARVDPGGTALMYCGYIGGAGQEEACGLAVDVAGNAYVAGWTGSDQKTFPVTAGPDLTLHGHSDAFVAKVSQALLFAAGVPWGGQVITLSILASDDAGLSYQVATSAGSGPIMIGSRRLDLSLDSLLVISVSDFWPSIFSGYRGVIDSKGQARVAIHIPNTPILIGVRLHSAFVTLSPAAPSGVCSISNTFMFSITK